MTRTFADGLHELSQRVGFGDLVGSVVVDQVYAHYQHERLDLRHPRGGQAKYLEQPFMAKRDTYLTEIARSLFDEGGAREAMKRCVEELSTSVEVHAPREWGDLARSGHPMVNDDGSLVYDRAPYAHRLSKEELHAKAMATPLPGALLGYIWWHVMHHEHPPNYKGGA
jgi:hypothetical protein